MARNGWPVIRRAQFALERRQPLPPDVAQYLVHAFQDISDGTPPAKALGLSISKRARMRRDEHIRHAAALMPARWSIYQKADQMLLSAPALEPFTQTTAELPELNNRPWKSELLAAIKTAPLPRLRQLQDVIAASTSSAKKPADNETMQDQEYAA